MNTKKISFGFLLLTILLSLQASVEKEFNDKILTDETGHGVNLIFAKGEIEKVFGEEGFFGGRSNQKESTFLHQALLVEDEKVRSVLVKNILNVRDLDLETLLKFQDAAGKTALFVAVEKNDVESIKLFLEKEKEINAAKKLPFVLNIVSIADNQGLTPLDLVKKDSTILELFKKHINDQTDKYTLFIGFDMLQQIDRYLAVLKKSEAKEESKASAPVKKEEVVVKDASKVTEKESNPPAPKEEKVTLAKEKEASQKIEIKKDEEQKKSELLKEATPQKEVVDESGQNPADKDTTGDTVDDVIENKSKDELNPSPSKDTESSLIKSVGISLALLISLAAAYTGYEWYEDYRELSEKNKELKDPLTESELRALAWKKTKKRFFEFFE